MEEVERENACGGWLAGKEFRLKGEERLKEKIAEDLEITPAMRPVGAIKKIHDVIRYTVCFESPDYSEGYRDVKQRLEVHGYQMAYSRNYWADDQADYRGINSRWITPEGQRFEVQFHTTESFHAKQQVTHRPYERIRNPLTQDEERPELERFQEEVSRWVATPEGAQEIPDHARRGR
jgi:hypothetical protein